MKKCSYCGKEYPDEAMACLVDERPLVRASSAGMRSQPTEGVTSADSVSYAEPNGRTAPESPHQLAANRDMLVGGLWCLGGIVVTVATYSAAANGGTYVVAWGAILFGAVQFIRGLNGESRTEMQVRDTSAEAQLMLDVAAKLESEDRAKAVEQYKEIVRLFPHTPASREAQRNIEALTTQQE